MALPVEEEKAELGVGGLELNVSSAYSPCIAQKFQVQLLLNSVDPYLEQI